MANSGWTPLLAAGAAAVLLVVAPAEATPAEPLKDKDPLVRLAAVDAIAGAPGKDAETRLLALLDDPDFEVAERAAAALGTCGTANSAERLSELALAAPSAGTRRAAARSAAKLDLARAVKALSKAARGGGAVRAFEAIAVMCASSPDAAAAELVKEGVAPSGRHPTDDSGARERDVVRPAAVAALCALPQGDRNLPHLAADDDPAVACAALELAVSSPDPANFDAFVRVLAHPALEECVERRLRFAIRACVDARRPGTGAAEFAKTALDGVSAGGSPVAAARFARVVGTLAAKRPGKEPDADLVAAAVATLTRAAGHEDAGLRGAAVASLGRVGAPSSLEALLRIAGSDADARVRLLAVRALREVELVPGERATLVLAGRLGDADTRVRCEAAVALGARGAKDAVPPLAKAVDAVVLDRKDPDWRLACTALVSMGLTGDAAALDPLSRVVRNAADWKLRGSAAAGLARLRVPEAVPALIDALDDKSSAVSATAAAALRPLAGKEPPANSKAWRAWWKSREKDFAWPDPDAAAREARRHGYAPNERGVWDDLDLVLDRGACGDYATDTFESQKVPFRIVQPASVQASGLTPWTVFVHGTVGTVPDDTEAIEWCVRSGGLLMSSGFDLRLCLVKIAPDCMATTESAPSGKSQTTLVPLSVCSDGPLVAGVFAPGVRPVRNANPRLMLEVLDPDRVDVLLDSPETAAAFGPSNAAVALRIGHGFALAVSGHVDVLGVPYFAGTKTADERAAIAMDRMGLSHAEVRRLRAEKVFDSLPRCGTEVLDLSAFRLLTNGVRAWRRGEAR